MCMWQFPHDCNKKERNKRLQWQKERERKNILRLFLYLFYFYFYDIIYFVISPEAVNGGYNYIYFYDPFICMNQGSLFVYKTQITDYFFSSRILEWCVRGKAIFFFFK